MQSTMVQISTVLSIIASLLLFIMFPRVSCSNELTNCMYAVNAACEIISSNNRDCKVTCETPQQIENVDTLENKMQELESRIAEMEQRLNQVHYSFYAELTSDVTSLENGGPIVLTGVKLNIGSAYSSTSGKFVVPTNGTYYFSCNSAMTTDNGHLYVVQEKNSVKSKVCSAESGDDDYGSLTVSCVMNLETDDEVYIEGGDDIGGRITITASSSFHGFLISAN